MRGLLIGLGCIGLGIGAVAATVPDLVGRWYVELREAGTFQGEKYTLRRQIEVNRPDGTKTVVFRYYTDCRLVGEQTASFVWGVSSDMYWARCTSMTVTGGTATSCSDSTEYDITSLSPSTLSYRTRGVGTLYNHVRVADDYRLPDSTCGAAAPRKP